MAAFLFWPSSKATAKTNMNQVINDVFTYHLDSTKYCKSEASQAMIINIDVEDNSIFNVANLKASNVATYNFSCLQSDTADTDISTNIKNNADQIAKAINSGFNILPSTSNTEVDANMVINLSTDIRTSFKQTCKATMQQYMATNITVKNYSVATIGTIDLEQTINMTVNCIQTSIENLKSYTVIENILKQVADSENKGITLPNILGIIAIVAGIIIIVVILKMLGGGGSSQQQATGPVQTAAAPTTTVPAPVPVSAVPK